MEGLCVLAGEAVIGGGAECETMVFDENGRL
jgi:hypothetical protein